MVTEKDIQTYLEKIFEQENASIIREFQILNKFTEEITFANEHILFNLEDCILIAKIINEIIQNPNPHPVERLWLSDINQVKLNNKIRISRSINALKIIIKSRLKYSSDLHKPHIYKGSFKLIKPYALLIIINSSGELLNAKRIVTWSSVPNPELRAKYSKFHQLQLAEQQGLTEDFFWVTTNSPELRNIYYQEYLGLPLNIIQDAYVVDAAKSGGYLTTHFGNMMEFRYQLAYSYLQSLYAIMQRGIWPTDLKQSNTCIIFTENSFKLNIIDYSSPALTFSGFIKQNNLKIFFNLVNNLRDPAKHHLLSVEQFNIIRNHLISEVFHMMIIFLSWPCIKYIREYSYRVPDFATNTVTPSLLLEVSSQNLEAIQINTQVLTTLVMPPKVLSFKQLIDLLLRLYNYPLFLEEEWINDLSNIVDNFYKPQPSRSP